MECPSVELLLDCLPFLVSLTLDLEKQPHLPQKTSVVYVLENTMLLRGIRKC